MAGKCPENIKNVYKMSGKRSILQSKEMDHQNSGQ